MLSVDAPTIPVFSPISVVEVLELVVWDSLPSLSSHEVALIRSDWNGDEVSFSFLDPDTCPF